MDGFNSIFLDFKYTSLSYLRRLVNSDWNVVLFFFNWMYLGHVVMEGIKPLVLA